MEGEPSHAGKFSHLELLRSGPLQQSVRLAEIRALTSSEVARHRRFLLKHFLRPLPSLIHSVLGNKEGCVVEVGLRPGRDRRRFMEILFRLFGLSRVCVGVSQQANGTVGIVFVIARGYLLQIGNRCRKVSQLHGRNTPPVVRIVRTRA